MITIVQTISNSIKDAVRYIKAVRYSSTDVVVPKSVLPAGIDSVPIKDMMAAYAKDESGNGVLLGYFNKSLLANEGEIRIFSIDNSGTVKAYAYCKSDGNLVLNGTADNAVRYSPLNTGLQNEVTIINSNFTAIAATITAMLAKLNPIAPTSTIPPYVPTSVTLDISSSKINTIKTP
jgi:hypothetical protein